MKDREDIIANFIVATVTIIMISLFLLAIIWKKAELLGQ